MQKHIFSTGEQKQRSHNNEDIAALFMTSLPYSIAQHSTTVKKKPQQIQTRGCDTLSEKIPILFLFLLTNNMIKS